MGVVFMQPWKLHALRYASVARTDLLLLEEDLQILRWYARNVSVAKPLVTAVAASSSARKTAVGPQSPPTTTALRAACTPQLTGLNRERTSIQCGIRAVGIRIDEMNIS